MYLVYSWELCNQKQTLGTNKAVLCRHWGNLAHTCLTSL